MALGKLSGRVSPPLARLPGPLPSLPRSSLRLTPPADTRRFWSSWQRRRRSLALLQVLVHVLALSVYIVVQPLVLPTSSTGPWCEGSTSRHARRRFGESNRRCLSSDTLRHDHRARGACRTEHHMSYCGTCPQWLQNPRLYRLRDAASHRCLREPGASLFSASHLGQTTTRPQALSILPSSLPCSRTALTTIVLARERLAL
ncbi:hypothetical protein FKP32DRAFT_393377 [Trametes sanguinea]|nr:hypothetical protein FKP32DRAFT_393377 [Trametes sanguinea]